LRVPVQQIVVEFREAGGLRLTDIQRRRLHRRGRNDIAVLGRRRIGAGFTALRADSVRTSR
jgi:hypothetical protein